MTASICLTTMLSRPRLITQRRRGVLCLVNLAAGPFYVTWQKSGEQEADPAGLSRMKFRTWPKRKARPEDIPTW